VSALTFSSAIYGSAWSSQAMREIFDDLPRTRAWLEILATLAEVQAEFGLIPAVEAKKIATICRKFDIDEGFLAEIAAGYQETGHSTMGLIKAVQARAPGESGEWFYYGTTVQDLTDTWLMRSLKAARGLLVADLAEIETALFRLSKDHRDTVMPGRTHGQQGLPITFGFKAAGWLSEIRHHLQRFTEIATRMDVGQLCGGVGSLSSLGPSALEIQAAFCERLGLKAPAISWTASRDVLAEWGNLLMLVTGTADRIGHEVYNLQRSELGEVSEGFVAGRVGSITMPHKRNPEIAEHLGSLARVVRANAQLLNEGLVHDHERDGRSWKTEWHAVPELTMAAGKSLNLLKEMTSGLVVHPERMRANLEASKGYTLSEAVMLALAERVGKQTAHRLVYETAMRAAEQGMPLRPAIAEDRAIMKHFSTQEIDALFEYTAQTGMCGALVDQVLQAQGR
jgi:adenylosuccinate lyase